jgi:Protein of unknown function (DUF1304)
MSYSSANVLVGIVAALHVLNSIVEMLFWRRPERLALNTEDAEKVAPIVANAGLYNGFLAAGPERHGRWLSDRNIISYMRNRRRDLRRRDIETDNLNCSRSSGRNRNDSCLDGEDRLVVGRLHA